MNILPDGAPGAFEFWISLGLGAALASAFSIAIQVSILRQDLSPQGSALRKEMMAILRRWRLSACMTSILALAIIYTQSQRLLAGALLLGLVGRVLSSLAILGRDDPRSFVLDSSNDCNTKGRDERS